MHVKRYWLKLVWLSCLGGMLGGCVPAPLGLYYKPYYDGDQSQVSYQGNACGGKAGPQSVMKLSLNDLILTLTADRAYRDDRTNRFLALSINLPYPHTMMFQDQTVRICKQKDSSCHNQLVDGMHIYATHDMVTTGWFNFQTFSPTPLIMATDVKNLSIVTSMQTRWLNGVVPKHIKMTLPAILFAQESKEAIGALVLEAKADKVPSYGGQAFWIYKTPEHDAELSTRYQQCLLDKRDKPGLHCEFILDADRGEYQRTYRGFDVSGRWYVFDEQKHTPLEAQVRYALHKADTWRLADNAITIEDVDNKTKHTTWLDKLVISMNYDAPMNTIVHGLVGSQYAQGTELSLQVNLGSEELGDYWLYLPDMWLDGHRISLHPIHLERRALDFGLEPFNC